jgi:hypothetical protein
VLANPGVAAVVSSLIPFLPQGFHEPPPCLLEESGCVHGAGRFQYAGEEGRLPLQSEFPWALLLCGLAFLSCAVWLDGR